MLPPSRLLQALGEDYWAELLGVLQKPFSFCAHSLGGALVALAFPIHRHTGQIAFSSLAIR